MTVQNSQPQAGTPASVSPDALTPEQATDTQPLTAEEYRAIAREEATRAAQSLVDKAENRISKRAQDQIAALDLTRQSLGLSDEDVTKAKQKIVYDDLTAAPQPAQPASQAAATQTNQPSNADPVIQETLDVYKAEGITLDVTDPEWKPVDAILKDPNGNIHLYRKQLYKSIEAKRQRVATNNAQAPARVMSGGTPEAGEALTTARTYLQRAHKQ